MGCSSVPLFHDARVTAGFRMRRERCELYCLRLHMRKRDDPRSTFPLSVRS